MSTAKLLSISPLDFTHHGKLTLHGFKDKDGLPQITVRCMTFDRDGYLWVGTEDGAAFYNGRKWQIVNMPNRAISNFIFTMIAAADGSICFGTSGGLAILKDHQWVCLDIQTGLPANAVHSLLESRDINGNPVLWIGTADGGLARLQDGRLRVIAAKSVLPAFNVQALLETRAADGSTILWVGLDGGGLARLHQGKWTIFDTNSKLPNDRVLHLLETHDDDGNKVLWACTYGGGLVKFAHNRWSVIDTNSGLPSNYTRCMLESRNPDGSSTLWVCTYGGGLAKFHNGVWSSLDTSSGLPCNDIRGVIESNHAGQKTLWVSIDGNGIARLPHSQWTIFDTTTGLPNNIVYSLLETSNQTSNQIGNQIGNQINNQISNQVNNYAGKALWIGTYSGGLARLQDNRWTIFDTDNGLPHNTVYCLAEGRDSDGAPLVWAGTECGLARLKQGRWSVFDTSTGLPANYIRCLYQYRAADGSSTLLVGTRGGGLAILAHNRWTIINTGSGLPSNNIESLLVTENPDGSMIIWVGTQSGLAKLENSKCTVYNTKSGLPNDHIGSLLMIENPDRSQTLWLGTYGGVAWINLSNLAINKSNNNSGRNNSGWQVLTDATNPALPNNTVYQLRADSRQRVYLCTNKGVARLTRRVPTAGNPAQFSVFTFTTDEGLPSNECNANASMVDRGGRIWVGTILGAAVFDPSSETDDCQSKPLYLARAELANGAQLTPQAVLAHNQNHLIFEYALLSFMREADTRYRTQLVGFDRQPSNWTTQYQKEYTNLPQGRYIFRVWGRDYRGNITGPVEQAFSIKAAPWRSWWAYTLYGGALAGAALGGINLRMQVLKQRNEALEAKISERTAELAQALAEVSLSQQATERKNQELLESQQRADRIFSALAQALPGTVLDGKYRLDEKIGSGGFGVVYRGTHLAMKRPIAVKVFKPTPGNDSAESLERFRQEAISACRINHLNAVAVLDSSISSEGIAYLVMELLDGYPLTTELRTRGLLPPKRCAEILLPICEVLAKAHASGIVHRDIKPDNIFLHKGSDGEIVKVVDFGIAKLLESSGSLDVRDLTATGGFVGTPTYMSPERIAGREYDGKSDVYSLGVLLYEMLCGRLPFSGKEGGIATLMFHHLSQMPPSIRAINPIISEALESVVMGALEKDPHRRPSARELGQQLSRVTGVKLNLSPSGNFNLKLPDIDQHNLSDQSSNYDSLDFDSTESAMLSDKQQHQLFFSEFGDSSEINVIKERREVDTVEENLVNKKG